MTPSQLLARIEALGSIDVKYVEKIRKQIEDPDKVVKSKAVVKYLLGKNQVTKAQAKQLLAPPTEDEMEVVQPAEDFDSSALIDTGDLRSQPAEPIDEAVAEPIDEAVAEPIIEAIAEPIEVKATMADQDPLAPEVIGHADEFSDQPVDDEPAYDDLTVSEVQTESRREYAAIEAFKGKRDQRDQFKTKWLFIGATILGLLGIGIFVLWIVVFGQNADAMIKAANDAHDRGNWGDATKKFTDAIEAFPAHKDVPAMKARRVQSVLRGKFQSRAYGEMITQASLLLPPLAEEKDTQLEIIRDDLSVILPRGLDEISAKAAKEMVANANNDVASMESELATILEYKKVIDNPVYIPKSRRSNQSLSDVLSRIDNNINLISGLIAKEKDYKSALVKIEDLRTQNKTDEAFNDYRVLTRNHPELASRKPLVDLMLSISKKESELVQPIQIDLKPKTTWRPSVVSQSVVLSATLGDPIASLEEEVVPVVVDGAAFGFNAGNGSLVWRHFVGQQTTMPPVTLDAERTLIVNQKDHDLICVQTQTGELVWRQEFGEAIRAPAIGPDSKFLVVSTESGKVIQLDAATGEVQLATQLPQSTGPSALPSTRDPIVYQVGKYSNLYVLNQQDYSCVEVYSLGHYKDAVVAPPIQWAGYILVAVNGGSSCDLHVFKPQKNGSDLIRIQLIQQALESPMSSPFINAGNIRLMVGENGGINMLSIDPTDDFEPIAADINVGVGSSDGTRPFVSAAGSNVWIAANGIERARISRSQGTIERGSEKSNVIQDGDQFLMAAQKLDDYVFHVHRRQKSGMLTAALANEKDLEIVWQTNFSGEVAGELAVIDDVLTAVSNQGDVFRLDAKAISTGNAVPKTYASKFRGDLKFNDVVQFGQSLAAVGPIGERAITKSITSNEDEVLDADLMFFDGEDSKLMRLTTPANVPACRPLQLDTDLIIASSTGYVARINPKNNRMVGTPFQPAISPDSTINWLPPIELGSDLLAIAIGESAGESNKLFVLSAENKRTISKLSEFESDVPFKGELNLFGDSILAVLGGDQVDTLATFAGQPLNKTGEVELAGAVVAGPWMVGEDLLVKLDNDKLYMFAKDLTRKWVQDSPNIQFAGAPKIADGKLMLCLKSGKVDFVNPATGERNGGFDLQQPIVSHPVTIGNEMYFSGADGTVHVLDRSQLPD